MTLFPLNTYVIILPDPIKSETTSGLIIGDLSKEKPMVGIVVECANSLQVKKGDKVLYLKDAGMNWVYNKHDVLILLEKELIAVLEG